MVNERCKNKEDVNGLETYEILIDVEEAIPGRTAITYN